jgi:hypothetical protein
LTVTRSLVGHVGHVLGEQREQDRALVHDLVVLDVVEQRGRCAGRVAGQEHRGAGHARQRRRLEVGQEQVDRQRGLLEPLAQHLAAALPGAHQREHEPATTSENQPPWVSLSRFEPKNARSIGRNASPSAIARAPPAPAPRRHARRGTRS